MAKKPDITTIASGYYSRQALNNNFESLRDKFDNTLSLDGSTPNAMGADFDVNGYRILNAGQIDTDALYLNGVAVTSASDVEFQTTYLTASYTGNGSTVAYSLTANPQSEGNVSVYVDGVYQNKNTFSLSGTTVTFSEAPPLNAAIEIVYPTNTDTLNGSLSSAITYNQGGINAQDRNVEQKLQETVSVKDFGAVGDGVTDDTAAIQAAIDSGKHLYGASGNYLITSTLTSNKGLIFDGGYCTIRTSSDFDAIDLTGTSGSYVCDVRNLILVNGSSPLTSSSSGLKGNVTGVFENIRSQFFQVGLDFTTNSFLLSVKNCTSYACMTGFKNESTTQSATTTVFDRCYALQCGLGFRLVGISDGEMRNCAIDVGVGPDYAIPCETAVSTQYLGSFSFSSTHIEGLPNPSDGYFDCFSFNQVTGAVNVNNTTFDIYENAIITRLFFASGYSSPYSRINISGNKQTPKGTMPSIVRYSMRTDNAAFKLYINSFGNSFIDTNCTVRVGSDGSGNIGESWIYENNDLRQIPQLYKLTGVSAGDLQSIPTSTYTSVNTHTGEVSVVSGGPNTAFTLSGVGVWLVTTFIGASGTNYRDVSVITSDGTDADITNIKTATQVAVSLSGLAVQIALSGGASGTVQYRALRIA